VITLLEIFDVFIIHQCAINDEYALFGKIPSRRGRGHRGARFALLRNGFYVKGTGTLTLG
jgi:hypothetical protein